ASDQALNLDRAPVGAPASDVPLAALPRRRRQHAVLRRHPSATPAGHPARHALLHRAREDHGRLADRDQRRAGRGAHESRLDRRRAQLVGRASLAARAHATASASASSTCSTTPSGICRKRAPSSWKASVSPVHRKRYAPSPERGLPSSRVLKTCSTWRASAAPELTSTTSGPSSLCNSGLISG